MNSTNTVSNRLAGESSLYLRMHAHNPVDWYPWGDEARAKAEAEGKLIFLSIGYSSCHWCHVMERESFMDEEVAAKLNRHFVAIKVDREERPDLDEIYMAALQVYLRLIGSPQGGGWPLNMFLTPDGKPVMGGTYFPPRDRNGQMGLLRVLDVVQTAWHERPAPLSGNAEILARLVREQLQAQPAQSEVLLDQRLLDGVLAALAEQFDPQYGGFGYNPADPRQPKFPQPANLVFLLEMARRARVGGSVGSVAGDARPDSRAESMLVTTLEQMAAGGIRDHLGGGFHRYSTDRLWAVPHFEKMLYDNAQLASVYAEAYALTGDASFRRIAAETLDFALREMAAPGGGFSAALDAESDGEEGQYYVWRYEELASVMGPDELGWLAEVYRFGQQSDADAGHVLLLRCPLREIAEARHQGSEELLSQWAPLRRKLLELRGRRTRPLTDTKVLTSWNGLMIRGLADGGRLVGDGRYTDAAAATAGFVLERLRTPQGRLWRTLGDGGPRLKAYLDDYSFLCDGLIALHRATGQRRWLEEAERLMAAQIELFWDDEHGGSFYTAGDHEPLIARSKDATDSALPSGNAVTVGNLVYLATALGNPEYLARAERTLAAFASLLQQIPLAMPQMAASLAAFLEARAQVKTR